MPDPLAYFLTFRGYGTLLHGESGAVDRRRNRYGEPGVPASDGLRAARAAAMTQPVMSFDCPARRAVADAIAETCEVRGWRLFALHVRVTHLHVVVRADGATPERVMTDLKAYATRRLRRDGLAGEDAKVWSRHGSTKRLFRGEQVRRAARYVVLDQGPWLDPSPGWDAGLLPAREVEHFHAAFGTATVRGPARSTAIRESRLPDGRGSEWKPR